MGSLATGATSAQGKRQALQRKDCRTTRGKLPEVLHSCEGPWVLTVLGTRLEANARSRSDSWSCDFPGKHGFPLNKIRRDRAVFSASVLAL